MLGRFHGHRHRCQQTLSVLSMPVVIPCVTGTRRGVVGSAVVVDDVGVANRASVIERRHSLVGREVINGRRCDATLGNFEWSHSGGMTAHSGCAALWHLLRRCRCARCAVYRRVECCVAPRIADACTGLSIHTFTAARCQHRWLHSIQPFGT